MPAAVKKPCKNDATHTYTGRESSPLGLGYSAEPERVGTIMEGIDKTMWVVSMKNRVKVWCRAPTELIKEKPVIKMPDDKETKVRIAVESESESESDEEDASDATPEPKAVVTKVVEAKVPEPKVVEAKVPEPKVVEAKVPEAKKAKPSAVKAKTVTPAAAAAETPPATVPKTSAALIKAAIAAVAKSKYEADEKDKPAAKTATATEDNSSTASKEKKTRTPTDYNIFMSWKMAEMDKEGPKLPHKEKFGKAAGEWKNLGDKKDEIMKLARAFQKTKVAA
jgi:hypothetical protein